MTYSVNDLAACLDKLAPKDRDFACNLVEKGRRYGVSEKQAFWVNKLTQRAKGEEPQREAVQVGDLTAAIQLFAKAREKLKFPKVTLEVDGRAIKLSVAGENAKLPGSITVASPKFGGAYYGRITVNGAFQPARDAAAVPTLVEYLKRFAAEPAKVAAEYGKLTGNCCFCLKPLSDDRSLAVGYGGTCAKNYGLPWGVK